MKNLINEEQNSGNPSIFEQLLKKYSLIWIWSITVGLNSGLAYSFFNLRFNNYGYTITTFLIAVNAMAFLSCIFSWLKLYTVLRRLVLPILMNSKDIFGLSEKESSRIIINSFSLAFYYVIITFVLRFAAILVEGLMDAFSKI